MTMQSSLFHDWSLLDNVVLPRVLDSGARQVLWSVGEPSDAVAVLMACRSGSRLRSRHKVFLSLTEPLGGTVGMTWSDIRQVPAVHRRALHRSEQRWEADRSLTEDILVGRPGEQVDLLTVRGGGDRSDALSLVRPGGMVLWVDDPPVRFLERPGWERGGERLFTRVSPVRPTPCERTGGAPPTLADRLDQQLLAQRHAGLARAVSRRYARRGESVEDLEQVAMFALVKAARRYEPEREISFSTFATAYMVGEIKRHFRDKTWMMRVPRSLQERYLEVKAARDELTNTIGRSPTVDEIGTHLGLTSEAVLEAMEAASSYWPESLDEPLRDDDESGVELPVVDPGYQLALDRHELLRAMPKLDDRSQLVLRRLYFDRLSQREIAAEIGVSQMQVSRLHGRALRRLRSSMEGAGA
jgi:RNA polymerase sigma-B factor